MATDPFLVTTLIDMVGSTLNSIFQNVNSKIRNQARKKLTAIANDIASKISKNQDLVNKIYEWKQTRSSELQQQIFSASGFGSAFKQFQKEIESIKSKSDKEINKINDENRKLNSSLNEINNAMNSMDNTISGAIVAGQVNSSLPNPSSNNSQVSNNSTTQSQNTLTQTGTFGKG